MGVTGSKAIEVKLPESEPVASTSKDVEKKASSIGSAFSATWGFMKGATNLGYRTVSHSCYYGLREGMKGAYQGAILGGGFVLGQMYNLDSSNVGFCQRHYDNGTFEGYNCPSTPFPMVQDLTNKYAGEYTGIYSENVLAYLTAAPVLVGILGGAILRGTLGAGYGIVSGLFGMNQAKPKQAKPKVEKKEENQEVETTSKGKERANPLVNRSRKPPTPPAKPDIAKAEEKKDK